MPRRRDLKSKFSSMDRPTRAVYILIWVLLLSCVYPVVGEKKERRRKGRLRRIGAQNQRQRVLRQGYAEQEALEILLEKQTTFDIQSVSTTNLATTDEAMAFCEDALESVAGDSKEVDEDGYVTFLSLVSDGTVDFPSFGEVSGTYALIFFAAACEDSTSCEDGVVSLSSDETSQSKVYLFCENVLSFVYTEVSVFFQYRVQYNDTMASQEEVSMCLEKATQNLLCDSFGCEQPNLESVERKLSPVAADMSNEELLHQDILNMMTEGERDLGIMSMPGGPSCPYSVGASVDMLVPTDCLSTPTSTGNVCMFVQSTVYVSAPKTIEPSEDALEARVIQTIRQAINDDAISGFLPPGCAVG